jgi:hypothetical protein
MPWYDAKLCKKGRDRVAYLGMLSLGGFVGALLTLGVNHIDGYSTFAKLVATVLGGSFSGVVMQFVDKHLGGKKMGSARFIYPVGLLLALFWLYVPALVDLATSETTKWIGRSGIVGVVLATLVALLLVLPPAFKEAWK